MAKIGKAFQQTKETSKIKALITAAANSGTKSALDVISKGLNSDNIQVVSHTLSALNFGPMLMAQPSP